MIGGNGRFLNNQRITGNGERPCCLQVGTGKQGVARPGGHLYGLRGGHSNKWKTSLEQESLLGLKTCNHLFKDSNNFVITFCCCGKGYD